MKLAEKSYFPVIHCGFLLSNCYFMHNKYIHTGSKRST